MPQIQSPPGAEAVIDGRRYLYFGGTGYLGLQGHPEVVRTACDALTRFGTGSATSRSGHGDTPPVVEVERRAAALFGTDTAFYFPSGYFGGDILFSACRGAFDAIYIDEFSHYSVCDAARHSGAPVHTFPHRDAAALAETLRATLPAGGRPLVASDGVFAALGRVAPVAEYVQVLAEHPGAVLAIDDAHGVGTLGDEGRGTFDDAGLWGNRVNCENRDDSPVDGCRLLMCGTLSKAFGGYGGIIPGSSDFVERLKASPRYYAGTSPPPVATAAASARALEIARTQPELRRRLWTNVRTVKSGLRAMGLAVDETRVPIVCLSIGTAAHLERLHRELAGRGIFVPYMPSYSGLSPEGALRLAIFATHTDAMIEQLLDTMRQLV